MVATDYSVELTAYEYDLLTRNEIISRACRRQLASVAEGDEMIELEMTLKDLEELTGFVAAESNHARSKRQREELGEICDYLETVVNRIRRNEAEF